MDASSTLLILNILRKYNCNFNFLTVTICPFSVLLSLVLMYIQSNTFYCFLLDLHNKLHLFHFLSRIRNHNNCNLSANIVLL